MNNGPAIDRALNKGLAFLANQQLASGGFMSWSSPSQRPFVGQCHYTTILVPSLILSCLAEVDSKPTLAIRKNLEGFLLGQRSPEWSYNYWASNGPEHQAVPYPDDLDDTFCALNALVAHDPGLGSADMLAAAVKILVSAETKPGGPYKTWMVSPSSDPVWLDVDLAVNANVAGFLARVGQSLPNLDAFFDKAIKDADITSPYYPSPVPLIYFLARGYSGHFRDELTKQSRVLLKASDNSLDRALLTSALLRLGAPRPDIRKLLGAQAPDGSWPAEAFCIDPAQGGQTFYNGAESLSTAFALEALALSAKRITKSRGNIHANAIGPIQRKTINLVRSQTASLESALKVAARDYCQRIATSSNGNEILGIPRRFNESLLLPLARSYEYLDRLAAANLLGWSAYTIYDDFLDDEGQPLLLPVANLAHRRSLELFQGKKSSFQKFVSKTFDTIDGANAWEIKNCRFPVSATTITIQTLPDFEKRDKLAERSLGHLLGPLSILDKQGFTPDSRQSLYIQGALRHYLIAKQLNDDAHDWRDDLRRGHITYVVSTLLAKAKIKPGEYDLDELISKLQTVFWYDALPAICATMRRHVKLSRRALSRCRILRPENIMTEILEKLEALIQETVKGQKQAKAFLNRYGE